ncbi:MAG: hypothetical protein HKN51_08210 [Saprospiraceae bacterium]|nr:hypothetical protein [Bacteroidia bacterium]NNE14948.1 hypothetical protein [Saprospiraceae bacterium]
MRKIRNYNILIIGDLMLDQYIKGKHLRQSPEADIPIILKASEENRLGGAGNVAINIKSLTANPILVSVTGNDAQSYKLKSILDKHQIKHQLIIDDSRPTTTKCRVINESYDQFIRIDHESESVISKAIQGEVIKAISGILSKNSIDALIIQDYNKGLITSELIEFIQKQALLKNIPVFTDPKNANFRILSDCKVFKPNLKEFKSYLELDKVNIDDLAKLVNHSDLLSKNFIITLAEEGVFYSNSHSSGIIKGVNIENPDVSGAGDTVISVITILYLLKYPLKSIALIANECGAFVCQKRGISSIPLLDFEKIINNQT